MVSVIHLCMTTQECLCIYTYTFTYKFASSHGAGKIGLLLTFLHSWIGIPLFDLVDSFTTCPSTSELQKFCSYVFFYHSVLLTLSKKFTIFNMIFKRS